MPRTRIQCARCGYVCDQVGHYKVHINRKKTCPPLVADVIPTLENSVRGDASTPTAGGALTAGVQVNVDGANNTVQMSIDNSDNSSTTTNSNNVTTHNTTNNININVQAPATLPTPLPYFYEDLSHITPEMWEAVVKVGTDNPGVAAMMLVSWVHFAPHAPQNHNVYFPDDSEFALYRKKLSDRVHWAWEHQKVLAGILLNDKADAIREYVDNNTGTIEPDLARAYARRYDTYGLPHDDPMLVRKMIGTLLGNSELIKTMRRGWVHDFTRNCPDQMS